MPTKIEPAAALIEDRLTVSPLPTADHDNTEQRESKLIACVKEYQNFLESGTAASVLEFIQQYPDLAPDLQECLEALVMMRSIDSPMLSSTAKSNRSPSPMVSADNQTPFLVDQVIDDFQILSELGRGGMGIVYEARQLSLGRRVALKVLPRAGALEPVQLQRFRNESQAAAALHHPHIVPVYAVGCQRGTHYYAMQLIEGQSCAEIIQHHCQSDASAKAATVSSTTQSNRSQARRQFIREAVRWTIQAANALEYAHQSGVIHRDIKPANLLIDRGGSLWVTDFGLAQFQSDSKLTQTGDMVGTLRYMSPEQIEGGNRGQDHRTDIYGLGATFFEILTSRPLITGRSYSEMITEITQHESISAHAIQPDVPRELATIIQKATAKLPSDRYRTMQELAEDLSRWLNDQPIHAKPPNVLERMAKWRKRHAALVNLGLCALVLCTIGLAWTTQAVLREQAKTRQALENEREERQRAEQALREAKRAVDVFSELGESELVNLPELRKLRSDFLNTALNFYREFVALHANEDGIGAELNTAAARIESIVDDLDLLNSIDPMLMLRYAKVQREIGLDLKVWERLDPIVTQLADQLLGSPNAMLRTSASNPASTRTAALESPNQLSELKLLVREARGYLTAAQLHRLRQLYWQNGLPMTFKSLEVAAELGLTPEQRIDIQRIIESEGSQNKPAPKPRPDLARAEPTRPAREPRPRPASPWASAQVRHTVERILQVLNEEQIVRWHELIGDPF